MKPEIEQLIKKFGLQTHPEGGYYKEVYRSSGTIPNSHLDSVFEGDRNFCTSIYFLLTAESFSSFHKINQDETWHFYSGNCIHLHIISPNCVYEKVLIGNNYDKGEVPQFTVPAQHYFAAEVVKDNGYAFVGCTVSPGFDFRDFQLPERDKLKLLFPKHGDIITRLTYK